MKVHELKTHVGPYGSVANGKKKAEFRLNDRGFEVGDILHLREWDLGTKDYTGASCRRLVTHMVNGPSFGIPLNYTMMSLEEVE